MPNQPIIQELEKEIANLELDILLIRRQILTLKQLQQELGAKEVEVTVPALFEDEMKEVIDGISQEADDAIRRCDAP